MSTFLAMIFSMTMMSGCGQSATPVASKKAYRPPVVWKTLKAVKKTPSVLNQLRPVIKESPRVEVVVKPATDQRERTSRKEGASGAIQTAGGKKKETWVPEPVPLPPHVSPGLHLPSGGWGLGR